MKIPNQRFTVVKKRREALIASLLFVFFGGESIAQMVLKAMRAANLMLKKLKYTVFKIFFKKFSKRY